MNAAIPERRPATEEISGVIERFTFHNEENGFCVLRVKTKGHREETTVVGSLPSVNAGEWLVAEGWWVRDKEHGLQFKATTMKTVPPTTAEGIERYLGSGFAKGIGPILAKKLVLPDRTEALVYILAHEPRHMHQQHGYAVHSSFPVGRVKNARGRYSEVCTGGLGRWRWVPERTFVWLNEFRRRVRYEKRADIHEAFLSLGCALICWRFLSRLGGGLKLALPVMH